MESITRGKLTEAVLINRKLINELDFAECIEID